MKSWLIGSNLLGFIASGTGSAPAMELEEGRTSDMEQALCFKFLEFEGDEREKREKGDDEEDEDEERETARRGSVEVTKKSRTTFPKQRMFSGDEGNEVGC